MSLLTYLSARHNGHDGGAGLQHDAGLFRAYGAQIVPVPIDQSGIVVKHLPQSRSGVAFVTPARQYPMGVILRLLDAMFC